MKAYIICFILTIFFTYIAEINFKKENKRWAIFFSVLAVFVPTFICAIRSLDVGRDINAYVKPTLIKALENDFVNYMNTYIVKKIESGYAILVYFVSKISSNINFLLFVQQFIPTTCVFVFAYYYRKKIPMWFVMATYLLTWYLRSYTIMRQSVAVGLIMLSILAFEKKKKLSTILLYIIAIYFHKSAIISIGIYLVLWLIDTKKIKSVYKFIFIFMTFIALIVVLYFYEPMLNFLTYNIKLLPEKFVNYLDSKFTNDEIEISVSETTFKSIFIFLGGVYLLIQRKNKKKDTDFIKYFIFYIISLGPYIISFKITNAERMNYYYYFPALLYIVPSLTKIFKDDKFNKIVSSISLIIILFVFWFFKYPIKKNCETYPYHTEILSFLNDKNN